MGMGIETEIDLYAIDLFHFPRGIPISLLRIYLFGTQPVSGCSYNLLAG